MTRIQDFPPRSLLVALFSLVALPAGSAAEPALADGFLPRVAALELSGGEAHPGDTIQASYEFLNAGTAPADAELTVFVHLRPALPGDPDASPAAGGDFRPLLPTFAWPAGAVVRETGRAIRIPDDFPEGEYTLLVGLYDPSGGGRVRMANDDLHAGAQRYRLAKLKVVAKARPLDGKPLSLRWRDTAGLPDAETLLGAPPGPEEAAHELRSDALRVSLSAVRPRVIAYERPDGKKLGGDSTGFPVRVRIHCAAGDTCRTTCLRDAAQFRPTLGPGEARYAVALRHDGKAAVDLDIVFRLDGETLRVGVECVREHEGFLLLDVWLPQVVSARAPAGEIVIPTQSGRLVRLAGSRPGVHGIGLNWFEADICGAVVGEGCAAAIRTRDWDSELEARVLGGRAVMSAAMPGATVGAAVGATVGATSGARPAATPGATAGGLSGGFAPRLALRAEASGRGARIRLAEAPGVEVAVVGDLDGDGTVGWVDAAKWLRRDVRGAPKALYADAMIYKIFCDSPGARDFTTFDEALDVIRRTHRLAPWLRQVAYLVGWQYEGHDTGYPATDRINERLGGLAGLKRLVEESARLGALVSFHDNFDDAYMTSPMWDERIIARDPRGDLQKGGTWAGGQSYIIACAKYARLEGLDRVRRTVAQMPVRESYHIDVLSAVPIRRDHRADAPESSRESLEGKFAIVREFNRLGIDVTSEGFTAPFVGVIGHSWHFWAERDAVFAGEEMIPFVPMIYHGGPTTWGHGGGGPRYPQECALLGATYSSDWTKHIEPHFMAEMIYLVVAPWTHLRDRRMEGYRRDGEVRRVTYGPGTFVEVDGRSGDWRVVADGVTVVENDLVVVRRPGMIAVFSRTARKAAVDLPREWDGKAIRATSALTGADSGVRVAGGKAVLDLEAAEPVIVTVAG